jgi:transcriptional regulator with XRE-family HTH domain
MSTTSDAVVAGLIGRRTRDLRESQQPRWSQEKLARQSELSRETIRRVELGLAIPDGTTLNALAGAFGLTLSDFLNFSVSGRYRGSVAA